MEPARCGSTSNPSSAIAIAGATIRAIGSLPKRSRAACTPAMNPGTRAVRPLGVPPPVSGSIPGIDSGSVSSIGVLYPAFR